MRRTPVRSTFVALVCTSLLAVSLAFAGTTATASTTAERAAAGTLKVSPARLESGGTVTARGSVRSGPRPVVVQTKAPGGKWRTVARGKSTRAGAFKVPFKLRSGVTRRYSVRVVAPKARVRGKARSVVVTRTVTARVTPAGDPTLEAQVLALVNAERAAATTPCAPVVAEAHLRAAARGHSADMAAKNYFSHTAPNGSGQIDRVKAEGYTGYRLLGENIAAGQPTAQDVMTAWMNSSGHRANILNCGFKHLGVGVARGGTYGIYWTQNFGAR